MESRRFIADHSIIEVLDGGVGVHYLVYMYNYKVGYNGVHPHNVKFSPRFLTYITGNFNTLLKALIMMWLIQRCFEVWTVLKCLGHEYWKGNSGARTYTHTAHANTVFYAQSGAQGPFAQRMSMDHRAGRTDTRDVRRTVVFTEDDGQTLVLDWMGVREPATVKVIFFLIHGMGGNSQSPYIRIWNDILASHGAQQRGWMAVAMNRRGHLPGFPLTKDAIRLPTYTDDIDIKYVWRLCREAYPGAKLVAVGYSLGANCIMHAMQERHAIPDMIMTVSYPMDMFCMAKYIREQPWIDRILGMYTWDILLRNNDWFKQRGVFPSIWWHRKLTDLEQFFSADLYPKFGVGIARDTGAYNRYQHIQESDAVMTFYECPVPVLCFASLDDPFLCPQTFLHMQVAAERNPNITAIITEHGGHVGWMDHQDQDDIPWIYRVMNRVLSADDR